MTDIKTYKSICKNLISYLNKYEDSSCSADAHLNTALAEAILLLDTDSQKELLKESKEARAVLLLESQHLNIANSEFLELYYVKEAIEKAEAELS